MHIKTDEHKMILPEDLFMPKDLLLANRDRNTIIVGNNKGNISDYIGLSLMQGKTSFVVMDPGGTFCDGYSGYLADKGYKVKRLDFVHTDRSSHYNPFSYISSDRDIETLVMSMTDSALKAIRDDDKKHYVISGCRPLLVALMSYVCHYEKEKNRNFSYIVSLLAEELRSMKSYSSRLDEMFGSIENNEPGSHALKNYKAFSLAAGTYGRNRMNYISACLEILKVFTIEEIADLTSSDDMELDRIGDEMTAVFVTVPKRCSIFDLAVSMFFTQFFNVMIDYCENRAEFTQVVADGDGNVIKCFRADKDCMYHQKFSRNAPALINTSPEEFFAMLSKEAEKEAEDFLERAKKGRILYNEDAGRYEVVTARNELVCFRGSEEDAEEALRRVKNGKLINRADCANRGMALPIQTWVIFVGLPHTYGIWRLEMLLAILRKYGIFVSIATKSLVQLQEEYGDDNSWPEAEVNCDTIVLFKKGQGQRMI